MKLHTLMVTAIVLAAAPSFAQQPPVPPAATGVVVPASTASDAPAWGTGSSSVLSLPAHSFAPSKSSTTFETALIPGGIANQCRYRTGGSSLDSFAAPINLPTGALIHAVDMTFCDANAAAGLSSSVVMNHRGGFIDNAVAVESSAAETPFCANRTVALSSPITVDNSTTAYTLEVSLGASNFSTAVCTARVYYKLQVSPAPATATFADVPVGDPLHRFVEALVAAGITGGCGSGNYCPNAAVTRGQMAVFLAAALGLHWPN